MTVIGDAGGTGTSWRIIHEDGTIRQLQTIGLNVNHTRVTDYLAAIKSDLEPYLNASRIYFYVAGLSERPDNRAGVLRSFADFFQEGTVQIENDLLGAARSLCGAEPGWAGILGTGANMAFYDGKDIVRRIPALGYVLGDEGSGVHLGRRLLADFCRGRMAADLVKVFEDDYGVTEADIIEATYQGDNPKSFIASFAEFLSRHLSHPYCYGLVKDALRLHVKTFLGDAGEDPVHYTGSIAFYFSGILRNVLSEEGLVCGRISESPIAGLTLYHQEQ